MSILLPSKPTQIAGIVTNINEVSNTLTTDDSGLFVYDDNTPNTNIILKTNGNNAFYISDTQRIGINITPSLTKRLIINDDLGETIRLVYKNSDPHFNKYVDIDVSETGSLIFKTFEDQFFDFQNVNGNGTNIKINNDIVYTTAEQLNYNVISNPGIAEALKTLVVDDNKNIGGINKLSIEELELKNTLSLDVDTVTYCLSVKNGTGMCFKLESETDYAIFNIPVSGVLNIYNNQNIVEILSDKNNNLIYPMHLTTQNNLNNTGVGIKFNTYNNDNIKKNMASIETIITNNQNNNENSIIKFNNMNNGNLTNTVTIRNDGYILCNTIMELSDQRMKNILKYSDKEESLSKILNLNIYNFTYKNDNKKIIHTGLMAQELHKVIPSAINIDKFNDIYTISNKELIGYLIDCIQLLNKRINKLENK